MKEAPRIRTRDMDIVGIESLPAAVDGLRNGYTPRGRSGQRGNQRRRPGLYRLPRGMIGRITLDGCAASWRTVWCAVTRRLEVPNGSPVLGLRSKVGKRLLVTSIRIRWPFLNTLLVTIDSMTSSVGSFGVSSTGADSDCR